MGGGHTHKERKYKTRGQICSGVLKSVRIILPITIWPNGRYMDECEIEYSNDPDNKLREEVYKVKRPRGWDTNEERYLVKL